jgi:membrane dipeptidase
LDRRHFVAGTLAAPAFLWSRSLAQTPEPIPLADMHFHSFFGNSTHHSRPLAPMMAGGHATLVAWSLVGDIPFVDWRIYKQKTEPKAGEAQGWFERELARIKAHCTEQKLKIALTPADVDRAALGEPHIILAVEGASFIEHDASAVQRAYDLGIRHLQLVHYIRSPLGDIQTEKPELKGLGSLGREVVQECNRLGILVDVAHCTSAAIHEVLELSKVPVISSHGSVTRGLAPHPGLIKWKARQLPLDTAKAIAKKGGVVGLWGLTVDVGRTVEAYADRMSELVQLLGEDHVGFGTDINGLAQYALFSTYTELRRVVDHWQRQNIPVARMRKLAMGNYARVLKAAMRPVRG